MDTFEREQHEAAEDRREQAEMDRERFQEAPAPWYERRDDVCALAQWLHEHWYWMGSTEPIDRLIEFFQEPHKWDREWQLYRLWLNIPHEEVKQRIVEALDENDTDVGQILAEIEESNAE